MERADIAQGLLNSTLPAEAFDVEFMLALASQHAQDGDGGTEADDLERHLSIMWLAMSPAQREAFKRSAALHEVIDGAGQDGEALAPQPNPLRWLMKVARDHGADSEPDHQVGDLQSFLREAWATLSLVQRRNYLADPDVEELLALAGCEPMAVDTDDIEPGEAEAARAFFGVPADQPLPVMSQLDLVNLHRLHRACPDVEAERPEHTVPMRERG